MNELFPLKLADGKNFFNRKGEIKQLMHNIESIRHTVLISPRRYGKSSLVNMAVNKSRLPFASVDLFLANNNAAITKRILKGISELVSSIMPVNQKVLVKVQALFSKYRVTLGIQGFHLEAVYENPSIDSVEQIYDALFILCELLKKEKKKAVFFIDEFQDIINAADSKAIQGAIRNVAQQTKELVFIFSGSNRRLLSELFDDSFMPLYMLCEKIFLKRIAGSEYHKHLSTLYQQKWGQRMPDSIIHKILKLTECHTFYVNYLCNKVWTLNHPPKPEEIEQIWEVCFQDEQRRLRAELEKLSVNQQEVLKQLALLPTALVNGQAFVAQTGLALSSIRQTIQALIDRDLIYQVTEVDPYLSTFKCHEYRVLDPLMSFGLKKIYSL